MLRAITNSNIGSISQINAGDFQSNIGQNIILGGGISATFKSKGGTSSTGGIRINVIGTGMLAASYIDLEVTCADLQTGKKGLDFEVADQLVALIGRLAGTAQQRGFTDAVARLQGAADRADRTVRVGAAGQGAGDCHGSGGQCGIFHKVTAGECIGHVRSSFKKQISTALRHYL